MERKKDIMGKNKKIEQLSCSIFYFPNIEE
jgi:hypothetical protein